MNMNELKLGLEDALGELRGRKTRTTGTEAAGFCSARHNVSDWKLDRAIAAIEHLQTAVEAGEMIDCRELR